MPDPTLRTIERVVRSRPTERALVSPCCRADVRLAGGVYSCLGCGGEVGPASEDSGPAGLARLVVAERRGADA